MATKVKVDNSAHARLREVIGCRTIFSRAGNSSAQDISNPSHHADIALSRIKYAISDLASATFSSPKTIDDSGTDNLPCHIKLSRSILGRDLLRGSNHNVLIAAAQAFAESAGVDPSHVTVEKQHGRFLLPSRVKILLVADTLADMKKIMDYAHPPQRQDFNTVAPA